MRDCTSRWEDEPTSGDGTQRDGKGIRVGGKVRKQGTNGWRRHKEVGRAREQSGDGWRVRQRMETVREWVERHVNGWEGARMGMVGGTVNGRVGANGLGEVVGAVNRLNGVFFVGSDSNGLVVVGWQARTGRGYASACVGLR